MVLLHLYHNAQCTQGWHAKHRCRPGSTTLCFAVMTFRCHHPTVLSALYLVHHQDMLLCRDLAGERELLWGQHRQVLCLFVTFCACPCG